AASIGDDGAVIGTEFGTSVEQLTLQPLRHVFQRSTQAPIGTHTTGNHQSLETGSLKRTAAFDGQRIDHRLLKGQSDVTTRLLAVITRSHTALPSRQRRGFQAAEAEIQASS